MFDTIYVNKSAEGFYGVIPDIVNKSLQLNQHYPKVKCGGVHDIYISHYSSNKTKTIAAIGDFVLKVIVWTNHSLSMEIASAFLRLDTGSYISVKAVESGWKTAIIAYEIRNSTEQNIWLSWVYVMLDSGNFYKFKSWAPEGNTIYSLTPEGFVIVIDHRMYRFDRDTLGMRLNVIKYNGPELSALMFYEGNIGLAIVQVQNYTFIHKVSYDLAQISPSYECCNGNYSLERTSTHTPLISTLNSNGVLTIYANMDNLNEKIVTSILPGTHNVSVDAYNGYVSILELGINYTRKTTITKFGVKHIEEPQLLLERYVLAHGTYRQAPGSSFASPKIYEELEHLGEVCLDTRPHKILSVFFGGRVAHYIAPHISPQWYFTRTASGEITVAPSLPNELTLNPVECTPAQHTEVFALALLVGSPVNVEKIRCYNNEVTGEFKVHYAFGPHMSMHRHGWGPDILRHTKTYIKKHEAPGGNWIFPEVDDTCKNGILCNEDLLISTLSMLCPNATKIFNDVLQPAACTYSSAEWKLSSHKETSGTAVAENIQMHLLDTLGAISYICDN